MRFLRYILYYFIFCGLVFGIFWVRHKIENSVIVKEVPIYRERVVEKRVEVPIYKDGSMIKLKPLDHYDPISQEIQQVVRRTCSVYVMTCDEEKWDIVTDQNNNRYLLTY